MTKSICFLLIKVLIKYAILILYLVNKVILLSLKSSSYEDRPLYNILRILFLW